MEDRKRTMSRPALLEGPSTSVSTLDRCAILPPMETADLRAYATDAIKFWEPRRILYNIALAAIVIAYFTIGYPASKAALTVDFCLGLFLLAVISNVAYFAAYVVDIFAQASGFRAVWQRYRIVLFIIGTLVAAILTRFIAMGMFNGRSGPVAT